MNILKALSHLMANSSSHTRASDDNVNVATCRTVRSGNTLGRFAPTARIHACGGLMTALNDVTPIIPRFEILLFCKSRCDVGNGAVGDGGEASEQQLM
jgi:hypothetical protein